MRVGATGGLSGCSFAALIGVAVNRTAQVVSWIEPHELNLHRF